jgi:putative membrane protein
MAVQLPMTASAPPTNLGKASDHLANERTFLAWIRTSISVIVFGFVVAKFGITLREFLRMQTKAGRESGMSLAIGVGFMAMGIFMALVSLVRYRTTMNRLKADEFQPADTIITALGLIAAFFGVILAVYLIYTARTL